MAKGWYGNKQAHSLASKGIKSSIEDFRKRLFVTKAEIHNYTKAFKNKNARIFAKKFNENINLTLKTIAKINEKEKSVKWNFTSIGNDYYYKDSYGNKWEEIKIYDKQDNFIRLMRKYATSGYGIKDGKSNKVIRLLEECGENNITYEEVFSGNLTIVKIYYRGNSFDKINILRKNMDKKLKNELGIKEFKRG